MIDDILEMDRDEPIDWLRSGWLQRAAYVTLNADRIYVRVKLNGKWQSVALSNLPDAQKIAETRRLVARNIEPTMVVQ